LRNSGGTTFVKLARLGSSLKNQLYGFTNFFAEHQQPHKQHHPQPLNLVLFIELTVACCWGLYQAWTISKTRFLIKIASAMLRDKTLPNTIL
jgi:hypothetical protein